MNFRIFITLLAAAEASQFNFLSQLPDDFNGNDDRAPTRQVFVSQNIKLNWVDSFMFCKSNGFRLAQLSSSDDFKLKQHLNLNSHDEKLIVDGTNHIEASACSIIDMSDSTVLLKNISCTKAQFKFLCETGIASDDEFVDPEFESKEERDWPLLYLGREISEVNEAVKRYYMSSSELRLSLIDGVKLCHSMDMTLASPRNQDEYDNIRKLLSKTEHSWSNLFIEAYRSESDESVWLSGGEKLNYNVSFVSNQPDNLQGVESCLEFVKNSVKMNDMQCSKKGQVLCERSNIVKPSKFNRQGLLKFLQPIAEYSYSALDETISKKLYASHAFMKASWIEARLVCKSFGMDLFSTDTEVEAELVRSVLSSNENLPGHLLIDVTNLERDDHKKQCVMMQRENGSYLNRKVSCSLLETSFLCQDSFSKSVSEELEVEAKPEHEEQSLEFNWIGEQTFPLQESSDGNEPLIKPDVAICDNDQKMFDSEGQYLKTACQVSDATSYGDACVNSGMNLFVIDSPHTQNELLKFATSVFGSGQGSTLWINGKKDKEGNWFSYSPDKQSLMAGIEDITDPKDYQRSFPRSRFTADLDRPTCLIVSAFQAFKVDTEFCSTRMYSICEYKESLEYI